MRGLPDKPRACDIADVGDDDAANDLPVNCQARGTRRANRTCWGCRIPTCTPCRFDWETCRACHWLDGRRHIGARAEPGSEAQVNSEMVALDSGDQTCEEAVVRKCTAETYVSGDTSKFALGGAWRPGWLAWCLWTMLILIVSGTTFVLSSEAQVDDGVSDAGDQTRDVIYVLGSEAQVNDGVLNAGDQACYEISVLGPEAQVNDGVLDTGDQAYDDVMFMLNANAKVDDDQFVLDAVDQNYVEEHTMNDEAQVNDGVLGSGGPSDAEEYASNAEDQVYYETMNTIGCMTATCAFSHGARDQVSVVHGDEFTTAGPARGTDWFEGVTTKHVKLVCKARPGKEPGRPREDQSGSAWEADPRHAELAIQGLGLARARARRSPGGVKTPDGDKAIVLETEAKSAYRAVAARLSDTPSSMPMLLLAANECEKASTCSSQADLPHLKQNGRSSTKEPPCVWNFPWQDEIYVTEDFADAGGYAKTGHSTSGGVLRRGGHTLCAWSSSQKAVALSSCESEYYSLVRCVDEASDLGETLKEMQSNYSIRRWARRLALRTGGGQIKHMQASTTGCRSASRLGSSPWRRSAAL